MVTVFARSGSTEYAGTRWAMRLKSESTLLSSKPLKAGEDYYGEPGDTADNAYRWGDYTGMTIDPDGKTFWYLGEYSKSLFNTRWATYIGSFSFGCTGPSIFVDGFESGNTSMWSAAVP